MAGDLMALAYHEAGHAVMAHILGVGIKTVRIEPENHDGQTEVIQSPQHWRDHVTLLLAGGRAEFRYDPVRSKTSHASVGDSGRIQTCLGNHVDPSGMSDLEEKDRKIEELDTELTTKCQQIIDDNWPAVKALAKELFAMHKICGARATDIIEAALP